MKDRPITLNATSPFERSLSQAQQRQIWRAFLDSKDGLRHSNKAGTLPFLIRMCEKRAVGYQLTFMPGMGYVMRRTKELE